MDFSNLSSKKAVCEIIKNSSKHIRNQAPATVLTLSNISNTPISGEIKDVFVDFLNGNKPYVKTGAVIGIHGLQSILYNAIMKATGRNLKSIESFEEAKEWIVQNS